MALRSVVQKSVTINGRSHTVKANVDSDIAPAFNKALPVAFTGSLTTRTSNSAGTLTLQNGHTVATGNRLDIFWVEAGVPKHRRGVTVGTVAGQAVPISGGAGDNLPVALAAITAMVPVVEALTFTGDNMSLLVITSRTGGLVVLTDAGDVEKHSVFLGGASYADDTYIWSLADGATNPLAGDTPTKIYFSHGDSVVAGSIYGSLGYT